MPRSQSLSLYFYLFIGGPQGGIEVELTNDRKLVKKNYLEKSCLIAHMMVPIHSNACMGYFISFLLHIRLLSYEIRLLVEVYISIECLSLSLCLV